MARRTSFSSGLAALEMVSGLGILQCVWDQNSADETGCMEIVAVAISLAMLVYTAWISIEIERQSTRDEAQPADVILVLGAAEYRGPRRRF
jgi:hypothetical protein